MTSRLLMCSSFVRWPDTVSAACALFEVEVVDRVRDQPLGFRIRRNKGTIRRAGSERIDTPCASPAASFLPSLSTFSKKSFYYHNQTSIVNLYHQLHVSHLAALPALP